MRSFLLSRRVCWLEYRRSTHQIFNISARGYSISARLSKVSARCTLVTNSFDTYCPKTWFSERSLRFSSLTLSTRCDRSTRSNLLFVSELDRRINCFRQKCPLTIQCILQLQHLWYQSGLLFLLVRVDVWLQTVCARARAIVVHAGQRVRRFRSIKIIVVRVIDDVWQMKGGL